MKLKLTKQQKNIAIANGISVTTLYRRINNGWKIEDAMNIPTEDKVIKKQRSSLFSAERGKLRSFRLPSEYDGKIEALADERGLTMLDLASEIIVNYLQENPIPSWRQSGEN